MLFFSCIFIFFSASLTSSDQPSDVINIIFLGKFFTLPFFCSQKRFSVRDRECLINCLYTPLRALGVCWCVCMFVGVRVNEIGPN